MTTVLVTGATGLIGANVCKLLRTTGIETRALVRPGSPHAALSELEVEVISGDITSREDVLAAADGVDAIVNSAAQLGGAQQDMEEQMEVNYLGSIHCYDAGKRSGARIVELTTTPFLRYDITLTERPEMLPADRMSTDPYAVSKGRAYAEGQERVSAGEDIVFVIPGGTFGPSPEVQRAMARTSFNTLLRAGLRGRVAEYGSFPVPWTRAEDVADCVVRAITRGIAGLTYIAFCDVSEIMTTAGFLNLACEIAGLPHRTRDVVVTRDDLEARKRYGETMVELMTRTVPSPQFDNSETRATLGYQPTPVAAALAETIDWMRLHGLIETVPT